jgi:hypothetical protein
MTLEDAPRLSLTQLRTLPSWPKIKSSGEAVVQLEVDGAVVEQKLVLELHDTPFGTRSWIRCPRCGARRMHVYLCNGTLGCRGCHGLLYFEQQLGRCRWKEQIAVPALRAARSRSASTSSRG